jgi:hypothetical protein
MADTSWRQWSHEEIADAFDYVRRNLPENLWREYVYAEVRWSQIGHYVSWRIRALLQELHPLSSSIEISWNIGEFRRYFTTSAFNQRPLAPFTPERAER